MSNQQPGAPEAPKTPSPAENKPVPQQQTQGDNKPDGDKPQQQT